jgi:hypothetical protein
MASCYGRFNVERDALCQTGSPLKNSKENDLMLEICLIDFFFFVFRLFYLDVQQEDYQLYYIAMNFGNCFLEILE